MIKEFVKMVGEFHDAFEVDRENVDWELRERLLNEELREFKEATTFENKTKEIIDVLYILAGNIDLCKSVEEEIDLYEVVFYQLRYAREMKIMHILPELFAEVHKSNMSKLENGKVLRREDGKILKGKNYKEANIKSILEKHNIR